MPPVKELVEFSVSKPGPTTRLPEPAIAPAVCVPLETFKTSLLPRLTIALPRLAIEAVGPLRLMVPLLAAGNEAPAAKVVVPVPLRPASVIVPPAAVNEALPALLRAARFWLAPTTVNDPPAATLMPLV